MQENVFCLGLAECKNEDMGVIINVEAMKAFICSFNPKMEPLDWIFIYLVCQQQSGVKYLTSFLFLSLFIEMREIV